MIYKARAALTKIFGCIAFISVVTLAICFWKLDYVGVKIQYFLIPTAVVSTILWWLINPDKDNSNVN